VIAQAQAHASSGGAPARKLRVAHVITDLTTGGAEMMLLRLLQAMDGARFEAEVISLKQTRPVGDRIAALGVPVRALGMKRLPSPGDVAKLVRWLRGGRFDVVQTWMTHADLIGGLAAKAARLPVAWGLHVGKLEPRTHGWTALAVAHVNARLSRVVPDRIVCCSETTVVEQSRLGYARHKMLVIPNGFDLDALKPDAAARASVRAELGLAPDALLVGQVGRFHKQKDHQNFFAAAHRVLARFPSVNFLLCGRDVTWENPQLVEWVGGARARFHVLGERQDIPRLSAALDVACSSSSFGEAFPLVIGEAMAAGVPCVVTDCGDSALMVGATGRVVAIRDPAAFAGAVEELLALGAGGRAALGAEARRRVEERYELRQIAARYHALYQELAR